MSTVPQPVPETERRNERSTIEFPYIDLDDAVQVARGIHHFGTKCDLTQLAAQLNQAVNGGGFRGRIVAARVFGVIMSDKGEASLTPLGLRIADSTQEQSARVEAFLNVPLYKALYDRYKGVSLPPGAGLENEMVTLGVSSKQKDKARQVFQRSARQAGFFTYGNDRLVLPTTAKLSTKPETDKLSHSEELQRRPQSVEGGCYHPFIQGLLEKLPEPDRAWNMEARAKWLQTAANIFDLMYVDPDAKGAIWIELKKGKDN
jgi:hypothetical protein